MKQDELKKAYAPVPERFHERVETALAEAKGGEEAAPRRRVRLGAVWAAAGLAALLLIGSIAAGAVFGGGEEKPEEGVRVNVETVDPQDLSGASRHGSVKPDDTDAVVVEVKGADFEAPEYARLHVTLPEGYAPAHRMYLKFARPDQKDGGLSMVLHRLDASVPVRNAYGTESRIAEESVNGHRVVRIGVNAPYNRIFLLIFEEENLALQVWAHESVTDEELRFFLENASVTPLEKEEYLAERASFAERCAEVFDNVDHLDEAKSVSLEWEEDGYGIRQGQSIYGESTVGAPKGTVMGKTEFVVEIETYDGTVF